MILDSYLGAHKTIPTMYIFGDGLSEICVWVEGETWTLGFWSFGLPPTHDFGANNVHNSIP